jgi:hypothetical protein
VRCKIRLPGPSHDRELQIKKAMVKTRWWCEQLTYTAQFGNGVSGTLSAQDTVAFMTNGSVG